MIVCEHARLFNPQASPHISSHCAQMGGVRDARTVCRSLDAQRCRVTVVRHLIRPPHLGLGNEPTIR
jgi:hypothetical protein